MMATIALHTVIVLLVKKYKPDAFCTAKCERSCRKCKRMLALTFEICMLLPSYKRAVKAFVMVLQAEIIRSQGTMPFYETTFITRPDLSRQDVTKLTEEMVAIVKSMDGKLVKEEYWGLRPLAYKINKASRGHYIFLGLEASPAAMQEMQRQAGISENIVRQLTVVVDAIDDKPSPLSGNRRDEGEVAA
jgi:small subunit ribosomal protein S6